MIEKNEGVTLSDYKVAYRKMSARKSRIGVIANFTAYVVVNSLLAAINLLFVPQFIWFIFPIVGWGIGLGLHYTFAVRLFDRLMTREEIEAERMAKKLRL